MRETSDELFRVAAGEVAGSLVSADQLPRLTHALKLLPPTRGGLALECHLNGAAAGRTDLCVRLFPSDRDRLLCDRPNASIAEILGFLQSWADPASDLAGVPYVDIECDITNTSQPPFLGATVGRDFARGARALAQERDESKSDGALRRTSALLSLYSIEEDIHRSVQESLEHCHSNLPPLGFLHGAAWLATRLSNPQNELRAIVSIPRPELAAYLARIGWPGDIELLLSRVGGFRARAKRVDLDLNIGVRGPTSRMGIYSPAPHLRSNGPELQESVAFLRGEGVGDEKLGAVLRWCESRDGRPSWVVPIIEFKYVWENDGPIQSKVYLDYLGTHDDDGPET